MSARRSRFASRTDSAGFRVAYLARARRTLFPDTFTLAEASAQVRRLKRRGLDAWVEDETGTFVPIPGVKRRPGFLA